MSHERYSSSLNEIKYSPDNNTIALVNGYDISIFNIETGKKIILHDNIKNIVGALAFSRDYKYLAAVKENDIIIWDLLKNKKIETLNGSGKILDITYSLDNEKLISSEDSGVYSWDLNSKQKIKIFDTDKDNLVWKLDLDESGKNLVSINKTNIKIWDINNEREIENIEYLGDFGDITFKKNEFLTLTYQDEKIIFQHLPERKKLIHGDAVSALSFDSKNKNLLSGGWDGFIKSWNIEKGREVAISKKHDGEITTMTYNHNDNNIIFANGKNKISISENGDRNTMVLYGDKNKYNNIKTIDLSTNEEHVKLSGHVEPISALAYKIKGSLLASASWDTTIRLWDMETKKEKYILGEDKEIEGADRPIYPILSIGKHNSSLIKQERSMTNNKSHIGYVLSLSFNPITEELASGAWDGSIRIWNLTTGKETKVLRGHNAEVLALAYSPDGKTLASSSGGDNTVWLWDTQTGEKIKSLQGHSAEISTLIYGLDGKTIVSGSWDSTIKLWDVQTGNLIKTLSNHDAEILSLYYDQSDAVIASGLCLSR